jgi:integrase/recombinase XerD
MQKKTVRKLKRGQNSTSTRDVSNSLTEEMFEKFIIMKRTEALAPRTLTDYKNNFTFFIQYVGNILTNKELNIEVFRGFIGHMLQEQNLSPVTANVRIRTMRAYIRFCFLEDFIDTPIHENFKPVKTPQNTLESLTPAEVKKILSVIDEDLYTGFRDKAIIFVLLDTLVRVSELVKIKRSNIDLNAGFIKLEAENTKIRKYRSVPLSSKTIKLISAYIKETEDFEEDILFLTYDGHYMKTSTVRLKLTQ